MRGRSFISLLNEFICAAAKFDLKLTDFQEIIEGFGFKTCFALLESASKPISRVYPDRYRSSKDKQVVLTLQKCYRGDAAGAIVTVPPEPECVLKSVIPHQSSA
jgi:hypothetical protein